VDLGFGRRGKNPPVNPPQGGAGQGKKGERSQSLAIYNRNMASLLKVKSGDGKGTLEICVKSATECRFSHRALKDISQEDAVKSVLAMGDTTDGFKERLIERIAASAGLFKH
jgi:hypothetical protein